MWSNAIRSVLDVQRVQQLISQQAIVVRGTPDQVLLAEKMVSDFDTAPPEVVVDLAVMQVSRDKVHKLGINPANQRVRPVAEQHQQHYLQQFLQQ